jgi:reductive dehalogenase
MTSSSLALEIRGGYVMVDVMIIVESVALALLSLVTLAFVVSSAWEREKRAALIAGLALCILLAGELGLFVLHAVGFFDSPVGFLALLAAGLVPVGMLVLLIPTGRNAKASLGTSALVVGDVERFDEREHVFARNRSLPPDSKEYRTFYTSHPDLEKRDAKRRGKGGPLGIAGTIDKPLEEPNVAALFAAFSIPQQLGSKRIVEPAAGTLFGGRSVPLSPEEATKRVKGFALHLGADLVGIAEVNPLWVYSKRGEIFGDNWEDWGTAIEVAHRYAVVFAMEMSREMVWAAPHTPGVLESGTVYARGAFIASLLASFIANLGYPATANHLRHYDVLLVPLAVDAGLGELGRLGYLITKEFGPRIRLGCVTTDLPLVPDRPVDFGIQHFCSVCQKCATCCPSKSIPFGAPREVNGTMRWKLDADTCFGYWGVVGTDCTLCMRVCPWSHPRTLSHRLITELAVRTGIARRAFSAADDIFYGKEPQPSNPPRWAQYQ